MGQIIVMILAIAAGGYLMFSQLKKDARCSQPATATVVGRERNRRRGYKGHRSTHYSPVVEFTADGQTVRATADVESIFAGKYKDGATLEIRYNPQDTQEIVVQGKSFRSGVLGGAFLILIGIAGLYFSIK